jgi:oligopeptide/dipeptide ABC transporter ATP-binding protein
LRNQRKAKPFAAAEQNGNILEVRNLKTYFYTEDGVVKAVDGLDFNVRRGEVLGLVGESGCGKSVTSLSIMRLVGSPGKVLEGEIMFDGQDLLKIPESDMVHIRGNRISMIFQQPQSSLNPVFKVGHQIAEVLDIHRSLGREKGWARAIELLKMVGIPDAERRAHAFPHELSGGMAQRVMIAMALACVPELLIADEPTTALDVTIQAQILDLMQDIRSKMEASIILITHDLGVVAEMADRVAVMYAGQIVEQTDVRTLFAQPMHPYTQGLIGSIPILGVVKDELEVIPGSVPNLVNLPVGCRFAPRCKARAEYNCDICAEVLPELRPVGPNHKVRCWLYHSSPAHGHVAPLRADTELPVSGD